MTSLAVLITAIPPTLETLGKYKLQEVDYCYGFNVADIEARSNVGAKG
jgi:hypothetical protein